jgi:GAF domain-containing protein
VPRSPHSGQLLEAVREFTSAILNPYDLDELLHRLMGHVTSVTGAQGAGVMLVGSGGLGFASASDERVVQLEVLQDRIESGACHEAAERNELVVVADLADEDRWPAYRDRALELGLRAVVGVPLNAAGQTIGVLNVYRADPGEWSPEDIDAVEIIAAMGAGYVLHATEVRAQHELAEQLQRALESRDTIGQAKGVLMARHGVDATGAFAMLRRLSQEHNIKLRDVAASLVEAERPTGSTDTDGPVDG